MATVLALGLPVVGFAASGELFQTMQRENAELKKQLQDLRVEHEKMGQELAACRQRLVGLAAERGALESRLKAAEEATGRAVKRADGAEAHGEQLAATLAELRKLLETQAGAVQSQNEQLALVAVEKQSLAAQASAAEKSSRQALAEAEAARQTAEQARQTAVRATATRHFNQAVLLARAGQFLAAEAEYLKSLAALPDDPDTHYNLGILYDDKLRQPAKAIRHYRRFLEIKPTGAEAAEVRKWLTALEAKR